MTNSLKTNIIKNFIANKKPLASGIGKYAVTKIFNKPKNISNNFNKVSIRKMHTKDALPNSMFGGPEKPRPPSLGALLVGLSIAYFVTQKK